MGKKMNKIVVGILSAFTTLCLLFGIGFTRVQKADYVGVAEGNSGNWVSAFNTAAPAVYDETTGFATMCPNAWGQRLFYNEQLTLDGLTVTIGSTNMTSGVRFGFGLTDLSPTSDGNYTPETGPFNVAIVPSQYSGQDSLYLNTTHADGTIVYTDTFAVGVCTVDGNVQNRYISAPSAETRYSLTFKYMGEFSAELGDYWQIKIVLEKGTPFQAHLSEVTVYFLQSSLNGILDTEGKCYLSSWGMPDSGVTMGDFYMGITTAEENQSLADVESALTAYKTARTSGGSVASERAAAVDLIATLPTKFQSTYQAKLAEIDAIDSNWKVGWLNNASSTATYDKTTNLTTIPSTTYGDRMYYGEKVALDGLTVILGSANMTANSRFGFGFTNDATGYTPETGPFNVTCVPVQSTGQDSLYLNTTHADGTIVYTDTFAVGVCTVDGNVQNRYISAPSAETRYSLTFKYMGEFSAELGDYWQIKIVLEKGTPFQAHLSEVTVYFLQSSLNGILDADGKCYISAWGMNNGAFYMNVQDASTQSLIADADAAKQAYEDAIISGEGVEEAKAAYEAAIEKLPANESVNHSVQLNDLELMETELENVDQSVSVTVSDNLTLNYKIKVPEICGVQTGTLVSEMRGESVTYTEADVMIDDQGRLVFKAQEVTPQYMTEDVTLTFTAYNGEGKCTITRQIVYSVRDYCEQLIADNYDMELRTALVDLLNYGAEAQKYVNKNTDKLANTNVSTYQDLATEFNASGATNVLAANQGSKVTFTAVTLLLEDKVCARAKFTTTANVSTLTARATIEGGEAVDLTIQEGKNGEYYVDLADIAPTQYAENIIFEVLYNGSVDAKCRYSVNSYVARKYGDTACGSLVKALYSYGVGISAYVNSLNLTTYNAIKDPFYTTGLTVYGTDDIEVNVVGTMSTVNEGATPMWEFGQWASEEDIYTQGTKTVNNGVYTFQDTVKTLTLDSNNGDVYMEIRGTQEYESGRKSGESWPHILLQQAWYNNDLVRMADMKSLRMRMDYKVSLLGQNASHNTNPGQLHRAQALWYITLQNRNLDSNDYGQFIWFGILLYDSYSVGKAAGGYSIDNEKDSATGAVIHQVPTANWAPNGVVPAQGATVSVDLDIVSYAKTAFEYSKKTYEVFQNSSWEDIYMGTMNVGIEIPGTYDVGVSISNIGLICTPNDTLLPAQNHS